MAYVTFAGQVRRARERWTAALLAAGVILVLWDPAVAADAALKFLLKKGIITQSEYDEAIRDAERAPGGSQPPVVPDTSTGQPAAAKPPAAQQPTAKAEPAQVSSDSDTTVDLGKGIKFGYDRGIYTQFKDTFPLRFSLLSRERGEGSRIDVIVRHRLLVAYLPVKCKQHSPTQNAKEERE